MGLFGPRAWVTPGGRVWAGYADMTQQTHIIIAGASGSGKSVVVNGIIATLLHYSPARAGLILIDPKRVELVQYRRVPHCVAYASEPADMVQALQRALDVTDRRYQDMARRGLRKFDGQDLYVIIDELADLMTTQKRTVLPLLQRLCQIGRAARVHVIAATQCPLASVIPTAIKVNFDAVMALRTRSAQDSRNIWGQRGCEDLPRYGRGYYVTPAGVQLVNIPMISDEDVSRLVSYWTSSACRG